MGAVCHTHGILGKRYETRVAFMTPFLKRPLFCVFQFPDNGAQIPCYLRLNAMRWLLKTALPAAFFDGRVLLIFYEISLFWSQNRDFRSRDRFESDCVPHHPVSANRPFPIRRQIGPFCADFRPLASRILVSARVDAFWLRFLAPRLRIQKFRSRRPGFQREV